MRAYRVRYYIATNPQPAGGCFFVREPIQAGPTSHAMLGTLCQAPVREFTHGDLRTYIFEMAGQ